jgi:hypothetical protein
VRGILLIMLLATGTSAMARECFPWKGQAPEMGTGSGSSAVALVSSGLLMVRGRRKKRDAHQSPDKNR